MESDSAGTQEEVVGLERKLEKTDTHPEILWQQKVDLLLTGFL